MLVGVSQSVGRSLVLESVCNPLRVQIRLCVVNGVRFSGVVIAELGYDVIYVSCVRSLLFLVPSALENSHPVLFSC